MDNIKTWLKDLYNLDGEISTVYGYANDNYKLVANDGQVFIVKLSFDNSEIELIQAQNDLLLFLAESADLKHFPHPLQSVNGNTFELIDGQVLYVLNWLEGELFKDASHSQELFFDFGKILGRLDRSLLKFNNLVIAQRFSDWDLQHALVTAPNISFIKNSEDRRLVEYYFLQLENEVLPEIPFLRKSIIHGDANDYNLLVKNDLISGIIDFGDTVYTPTINELAIALAYSLMDKDDPVGWAENIVKGYHLEFPIELREIELLYYLVAARLSISVTWSAVSKNKNPENEYLLISEAPAWNLLRKWIGINPLEFTNRMKAVCQIPASPERSKEELLSTRKRHVNPSLSISYSHPIVMEKAAMQYMYAGDGQTYLDCVNNICHVGHCHPKVVKAAQKQMAKLNTNTRYLYDSISVYAELLTAKFPDPLDTVFFVNSGSEAGDLAQRIARTITGQQNMIVLDHGYHGNTLAGIEVSPYKYETKGGPGKADHIFKMDIPDGYRGEYKYDDPDAGRKYAEQLDQILENIQIGNQGIAAFYCESIIGCGGQVVLPSGYLKEIYWRIREVGGLCISDEVQVGFGRVGEKFWGFELQEVVPDIVVIGKPMGNGHPIAAVVTTRAIADQFNNGMEYFSSFGGNPVSCAIGLEVLNVIEKEKLQENALTTGNYFKEQLLSLSRRHDIMGDVRGYGLFLGIELVEDRILLTPATVKAKQVVEDMKDRGILLSTDGPFNNVIKIKPPIVFNRNNVDFVIQELETTLSLIKDK